MNPLVSIEQFALIAVLALGVAGAVAWMAAPSVRWPLRSAMSCSRALGACGVLALLLNVGRWREKTDSPPSHWALLLDRSLSMTARDAGKGAGRTRWEEALDIVAEARRASPDRPDAARFYAFGENLESIAPDRVASLAPDAADTRIVAAGQDLLAREAGRGSTLRGILLLSDGRQPRRVAPDPFALRAAARGAPVFAVALGGPIRKRDIAIEAPQRRYVSFLGQPVTLGASVHNDAMGPVESQVRLLDPAGRAVKQARAFTTNGQSAGVQFEITPEKAGYFEYAIDLASAEGDDDRSNNRIPLGVFVLTEKLKVLLLEGEPYWDTKFLSHLLRGQSNMAVNAVFRVAQDRFFKVTGDSGLTAAGADTFPATDEEMARHDLVVLGRGTEYFIDAERAQRLNVFVRERGGCVFFARGKSYSGTESFLKEIEPLEWGEHTGGDFVLKPLLAGEQAGLFGGLLASRESPLWRSLPPLERAFRCGGLKDFASVLADGVPSAGGAPFPALVSRRIGRGLVVLVNGDGLWRWGFFPQVADKHDLYRNLWVRLFQWAVTFAEFNPGADFAMHTEPGTVRLGESIRVRISARVHTEGQRPFVRLHRGAEFLQTISLAPEREPCQWSGLVTPEQPGSYRLTVATEGKPDTGVQATVQVLPRPGEGDEPAADAAFLRELAELSGGRLVRREEVADLVRKLAEPVKVEQLGNVVWDPAWDKSWLALLVGGFLSLEWFWRRRQGLM